MPGLCCPARWSPVPNRKCLSYPCWTCRSWMPGMPKSSGSPDFRPKRVVSIAETNLSHEKMLRCVGSSRYLPTRYCGNGCSCRTWMHRHYGSWNRVNNGCRKRIRRLDKNWRHVFRFPSRTISRFRDNHWQRKDSRKHLPWSRSLYNRCLFLSTGWNWNRPQRLSCVSLRTDVRK